MTATSRIYFFSLEMVVIGDGRIKFPDGFVRHRFDGEAAVLIPSSCDIPHHWFSSVQIDVVEAVIPCFFLTATGLFCVLYHFHVLEVEAILCCEDDSVQHFLSADVLCCLFHVICYFCGEAVTLPVTFL